MRNVVRRIKTNSSLDILILFSEATLYYFFSTLAQVLAALVALIAVLVHFRINALRDFLVGDGNAILRRTEQKEKPIILSPCIQID
ncbi:hypothetical protein [Fodinibius sp.]|uniref:hypothetical protein n=1 Tax=Fodinibius sp. TaxID=1872440 RepID=UPI002ACE55B9|nr:hypothetical protein [Fodinibius sp.]MDZ7660747.1 hypothetical protein [Fodinibius sp.]